MPHQPSFLEQMTNDVFDPLSPGQHKSSTSCPILGEEKKKQHGGRQRQDVPPPFLTDDEVRMWHKERIKKDNHNQSKGETLFLWNLCLFTVN